MPLHRPRPHPHRRPPGAPNPAPGAGPRCARDRRDHRARPVLPTRTRSGARSCSTTSGRSATTRSSASSRTSSRGDTTGCPGRYVAYLSFALDYRLGGLATTGYHLVNVLVHVANALLVYALVRLTFRTPRLRGTRRSPRRRAPSRCVAAAVFVAHPLQSAGGRVRRPAAHLAHDPFYLATVVLYAAWRLRDAEPSSRWGRLGGGAAVVATALLAMRTKEIAFTLPVAVVLYELSFLEGPARTRLLRLAPVLATLPVIPLTTLAARGVGASGMIARLAASTRIDTPLPRLEYLTTQLVVIVRYLRLLVFPAGQNVDHDVPIYRSLLEPHVAALPRAARGARRGRGPPVPPDLPQDGRRRARSGGAARRVRHRVVLPRARRRVLGDPDLGPHVRAPGLPAVGGRLRRGGDRARGARPAGAAGGPRACHGARRSARLPAPVDRDPGPERGLGGRPVALVRRGPQVAAEAEAVREPRHRARALRPARARRPRAPTGGGARALLHLRPRAARRGAPHPRPSRRGRGRAPRRAPPRPRAIRRPSTTSRRSCGRHGPPRRGAPVSSSASSRSRHPPMRPRSGSRPRGRAPPRADPAAPPAVRIPKPCVPASSPTPSWPGRAVRRGRRRGSPDPHRSGEAV